MPERVKEPLINSIDGTDASKMINYFVAYTDVGKMREHGRGSFA